MKWELLDFADCPIKKGSFTFDRYNQLWNDGQDLVSSAVLQHVMDSLPCKEFPRVLRLTESVEEQWQVMVIVKLFDFNLPRSMEVRHSEERSRLDYWSTTSARFETDNVVDLLTATASMTH